MTKDTLLLPFPVTEQMNHKRHQYRYIHQNKKPEGDARM